MATEHVGEPIGDFVMVDVGSKESRQRLILDLAKGSADHHDRLSGAIECATVQILIQLFSTVIAGSLDQDDEMVPALAEAQAQYLVAHSTFNVNMVLLLGEAAALMDQCRRDEPLPAEFYGILPDDIGGE